MEQNFQSHTEKKMALLEAQMAPVFAKAPHLPQHVRETLVNIAPWLALVFGILGLFAILSAGTFGSMLSMRFLGMSMMQVPLAIGLLAGLLASLLDLAAYKPLTKREKKGWNYLFYGTVLMLVAMLVNLSFGLAEPTGLLGELVGFWLLFEVRGFYK